MRPGMRAGMRAGMRVPFDALQGLAAIEGRGPGVERPALTALLNRIGPESERDASAADEAERALAAPLRVLDAAVATQPYLLGDHFTVADLNVASILSWARQARVDLSAFPKAAAWLKTCHDRPAAQAARQLQRE